MMIRVCLLLLITFKLEAQVFYASPQMGMGNVGIGNKGLYSLGINPAGISSMKSLAVGIAYQNHYLIPDIQSQAFYMAIPVSSSTYLGLSANSYGLKGVSNLLTLRTVYARKFGKSISAAVAGNYHRYYVKNYESSQKGSLDIGFQYQISDEVTIGVLGRNMTYTSYDDAVSQSIPTEYAVGATYQLSKEVLIATDMYYDTYKKLNYHAGLEYALQQKIKVRGGLASQPLQYFTGVGLVWKKLDVDVALSFHPNLGTSPQLALMYVFE